MKKSILTALLLGLLAVGTSSCSVIAEDPAEGPPTPPAPDPVKVLEDRIETERELRVEAQDEAAEETIQRERWQLATIVLSGLVLVGFLVGTSIGSQGKRHAAAA